MEPHSHSHPRNLVMDSHFYHIHSAILHFSGTLPGRVRSSVQQLTTVHSRATGQNLSASSNGGKGSVQPLVPRRTVESFLPVVRPVVQTGPASPLASGPGSRTRCGRRLVRPACPRVGTSRFVSLAELAIGLLYKLTRGLVATACCIATRSAARESFVLALNMTATRLRALFVVYFVVLISDAAELQKVSEHRIRFSGARRPRSDQVHASRHRPTISQQKQGAENILPHVNGSSTLLDNVIHGRRLDGGREQALQPSPQYWLRDMNNNWKGSNEAYAKREAEKLKQMKAAARYDMCRDLYATRCRWEILNCSVSAGRSVRM